MCPLRILFRLGIQTYFQSLSLFFFSFLEKFYFSKQSSHYIEFTFCRGKGECTIQTKLGLQVYTQQNLPLSLAPILCLLVCSLGDKVITSNSRSFSAPQNSLPLPPLPTPSTLETFYLPGLASCGQLLRVESDFHWTLQNVSVLCVAK